MSLGSFGMERFAFLEDLDPVGAVGVGIAPILHATCLKVSLYVSALLWKWLPWVADLIHIWVYSLEGFAAVTERWVLAQ